VLKVRKSRITGMASFVSAADGARIPVEIPAGRVRPEPADFLKQYGGQFGITDPPRQLALVRTEVDALGHAHTTWQQTYAGVPVFSGILKVHQDADGWVLAANGDFYPIKPSLDVVPAFGAEDAVRRAEERYAHAWRGHATQLVIVDPGWYGDPPQGARLAYYVAVTDPETGAAEALFLDAHDGQVLDRWSLVCGALDRAIHDAGGTAELPGPLARGEGDPPAANANVNTVYDYAGDTYQYYWHAFGRDGLDGTGGTMVATVNSTAATCPNAFWNTILLQAAFCSGVISDDLVAHELTHGITQATANLIYQNQSGQINESFSDVFGELVDLFNGGAAFPGTPETPPSWAADPSGPDTDAPNNLRTTCSGYPDYINGVRWLFAEDVIPWNGAIRDCWAPPCMGDPDRAYSPLQTCSLADSGGVHSGSGIPNHAFAMLCDGKTFNGYTVTGIGPIKAGAVWYRALTVYLTVASDFEDAYAAISQAAADLVGTFPLDPRTGLPSASAMTIDDAEEVDMALRAVEMDTPGACGQTLPLLNSAPPLQCSNREVLFSDDFEGGTNGWTVFNSGPYTPYDWEQTAAPLPAGRAGVAWRCDDANVGDCSGGAVSEAGIHSLVGPPILLPPGLHLPTLAFTQYIETEPKWDGGHVLIRVDGGDWLTLPAAAFAYNPYNTTLFTASQTNTNPNAGQLSFSGADGQWSTSLVDLGTYVSSGQTLEVRFDFSKDDCYGITAWFIDDFEVYHCPDSADCNGNAVADEVDIAPGPHRDAFVVQPPNHSSGNPSDLDNGGLGVTAMADNFILLRPKTIEFVRLWGGYYPSSHPGVDKFAILIHEGGGGTPGPVVASRSDLPATRVATGGTFLAAGIAEYELTFVLDNPIVLPPGTYFVEILNDTTGNTDTFIWQRGTVGHILGAFGSLQAPGQSWIYDSLINMSCELYGPIVGYDCNSNLGLDECDAWGDHNGNGAADLGDVAAFVACQTGPNESATPECTCLLDADGDGDLDLLDLAALQRQFGSP